MMTEDERMKYLNDLAKSGKHVPMVTALQTDPEKNTWMQAARELPGDVMSAFNPQALKENSQLMYNSLMNPSKPEDQMFQMGHPPEPVQMNAEPNMFQKLRERFK